MPEIPINFLANCSIRSIEELMLSKANHAANIRKQLRIVIDQYIEEAVQEEFARWMLNNREEIRKEMKSLLNPVVLDGRSAGRGVAEELCLLRDKNSTGSTKE